MSGRGMDIQESILEACRKQPKARSTSAAALPLQTNLTGETFPLVQPLEAH